MTSAEKSSEIVDRDRCNMANMFQRIGALMALWLFVGLFFVAGVSAVLNAWVTIEDHGRNLIAVVIGALTWGVIGVFVFGRAHRSHAYTALRAPSVVGAVVCCLCVTVVTVLYSLSVPPQQAAIVQQMVIRVVLPLAAFGGVLCGHIVLWKKSMRERQRGDNK